MVSRHRPEPQPESQTEPDQRESARSPRRGRERSLEILQVQLVGRRIRRLRKGNRLSVPELAAAAGLQSADLARLEKGEYRVSLDVLFRLLAVLTTSVEAFFEDVARELAAAATPDALREL